MTTRGFFIDVEEPYLGAIPDGIIKAENAIIEIKCPYVARNLSPQDAILNKKVSFGYGW